MVWWSALPMLAVVPTAATAQTQPAPVPPTAAATPEQIVDFSANTVTYDSDVDVVTATGEVRMNREGNYLAADEVVWNRKSGEVRAIGNVVVLTPQGDKLVGDNVVLTDTLQDGTVENLLVVLEGGGRIAARRGTRKGDITTLENAIYSPCPVTTDTGCPKRPSWAITAVRVIDDPAHDRVRFEGGRFQLFGVTLPLLPIFNIARGTAGTTGWLVPDFSLSTKKGFEIAQPYRRQIGPNRDLTLTPHIYTGVLPAIEAKYRELNSIGAFQLGGFLTYGTIENVNPEATSTGEGFRAYFEANGKAQLDPYWSITSSIRVASDKTVTRRYDISSDDRLRSFVDAERISPDSYISIAGWAFQGLRSDDKQKQIPIALPAIDARFRMDGIIGGKLELQANSLSIIRIDGQDTQRAFASAQWDLRRLTPWGQEVTLTAYGRGDVYHTDDAESTAVPIYRGTNGWHARAIGALAADVQWPFVGSAVRRPAATRAARPARIDAADAQPRHPQRGRAIGRPRRQQSVRPEPLPGIRPVGGQVPRHLRRRLGVRASQPLDRKHDRTELSIDERSGDFSGWNGTYWPYFGYSGKNSGALWTADRRHRSISARQRHVRGSQKRGRSDGRHSADLCADRLFAAQPEYRSDDRGPSRQGGVTGGGARVVQPLLVDLRRDRDRPH